MAPDSFSVLLVSLDTQKVEQLLCKTFHLMTVNGVLTFKLDCLLQPRRLWIGNLLDSRCESQQVSDIKELS